MGQSRGKVTGLTSRWTQASVRVPGQEVVCQARRDTRGVNGCCIEPDTQCWDGDPRWGLAWEDLKEVTCTRTVTPDDSDRLQTSF